MTLTYATATPGFDIPPYHVEIFPYEVACVCNANGFNCLSFPDKPGAKFTTPEDAEAICEQWNAGKMLAFRTRSEPV